MIVKLFMLVKLASSARVVTSSARVVTNNAREVTSNARETRERGTRRKKKMLAGVQLWIKSVAHPGTRAGTLEKKLFLEPQKFYNGEYDWRDELFLFFKAI